MKVTFTDKDWDKLRNFQNTVNQKMGLQSYVGADYVCMMVEYSPELKAMLRPFPQEKHYTFELRALKCEDCPQEQPFLCAKDETTFLCSECYNKRQAKKAKDREKSQAKK